MLTVPLGSTVMLVLLTFRPCNVDAELAQNNLRYAWTSPRFPACLHHNKQEKLTMLLAL
jgi:hypothetical protein